MMVLGHIRLNPIQNIRMPPVIEIASSMVSVMNPDNTDASAVIDPCNTATVKAEKMQPFPMEAAMTIMIIRSNIA